MQAQEMTSLIGERPLSADERRERALERLDEMLRLQARLEQQLPADRPVPMEMVRRAVFALYREAVDAGAGPEAAAAIDARPADAARS